ncbi:MAG: hypothetical protein AAGI90_03985 [Chlamydiota bacterium]
MEDKIQKLEELYENISDLTPEKMESVVGESIHIFEQILDKLNSGSPEEREKASKYAERLKVQLEKQSKKALGALKISNEELEAFTSNRSNFSDAEWEALSKAKEELNLYRDHIKNTKHIDEIEKEHSKPKGARTKNAKWLAG